MAKADSPTKTCGEDGCSRPLRARGLCSTHYNQVHQPERHKKISVPCDWCGKACDKQPDAARGYAARFCSYLCRDAWRSWLAGDIASHLTKWHPAHPDYRLPLPVLWVAPQPTPPAPRVFVCGTCVRCGMPFVAEDYTDTARYCSLRCGKRVIKHRYRARKKQAYVADVSPAKIYERDGWRCKLCGKKVRRDQVVPHPLAPVLDHVVPLADGGTHEPANVQCAHYLCNSIKSDRGGNEQLALIG